MHREILQFQAWIDIQLLQGFYSRLVWLLYVQHTRVSILSSENRIFD